jgi:hypothetical protein
MSADLGFCPSCGRPLEPPVMGFCSRCGAALPTAAPATPVAAATPPVAPAAAAFTGGYPPVPGAPNATPPGYYGPSGQAGGPPPGWPGYYGNQAGPWAPPRSGVGPGLIIGIVLAVVAVVVVAGGLLLVVSRGSSASGSITFSPSTIDCSNPQAVVETDILPSSVKGSDVLVTTLDGETLGHGTLDSSTGNWTKEPNGTWKQVVTNSQTSISIMCEDSAYSSGMGTNYMSLGKHTETIETLSGKVLAQGSYTVK